MTPYATPALPVEPSRWERLTGGRDVEEVLEGLREGREGKLRQWVQRNWRSAYVPEAVLKELGLEGMEI